MRGIVTVVLVFVMLSAVQAGQPEEAFKFPATGVSGFQNILLVNWLIVQEPVESELKMTHEQIIKVNDWNKIFATKTSAILKLPTDVRDLDDKELTAEKMIPRVIEVGKVAYKDLGEILTQEQMNRLRQLNRQNLGVDAFAEVETELKLSDKQKEAIAQIRHDFATEYMSMGSFGVKLQPNGGIDPEVMKQKQADAKKKAIKLQEEAIAKAVKLLDENQKKTWKTLLGEPFDLTKLLSTIRVEK